DRPGRELARELLPQSAVGWVPDHDLAVGAGGCQEPAVRVERHAPHRFLEVAKDLTFRPAGRVPQPYGLPRRRGYESTVRAIRHLLDLGRRVHGSHWLATGYVPQPDRLVGAG